MSAISSGLAWSMTAVNRMTINGALNITNRRPAMTPPMMMSTRTPGSRRLTARSTHTAAKIAGKVGPPRNPLLKATASSASFTSAILTRVAGP